MTVKKLCAQIANEMFVCAYHVKNTTAQNIGGMFQVIGTAANMDILLA